jgi:glycerol-3-phosphate dehydrogenase subunit C
MKKTDPESIALKAVELCADCDHCRTFMIEDTPCLFFPKLYRLYDKEKERNEKITSEDLRHLVDLCNMCGLCPCPAVRANIREAKDAFVARDGLKPAIRVLEDVQRVGKVCGAFPRLANLLLETEPAASLLKRIAGIHPDRKFPKFPSEGFPAWAKKRGLDQKREGAGTKVAYFAGCTAQYLFPEVAKAAVEVMERNGMNVYVPEQKCCGMPSLLEGDRTFTFELAGFNLEKLGEAVDDGYDIVCSCPTCGYMLKDMFSEGAYFSDDYRAMVKELQSEFGGDATKIPVERLGDHLNVGRATPASERNRPPLWLNIIVKGLLRDEGYFASFEGRKRIKIASHTYDLGEYLKKLHRAGKLNVNLGPVTDHMAYYAPCHLKEQNIGQPWANLLNLVPKIAMEPVGGIFDCCGISGIMGLKQEFHHVSLAMGSRLMEKIDKIAPERLVSDCLSCRIQFNQVLPYKVFHPVEILNESYGTYRG